MKKGDQGKHARPGGLKVKFTERGEHKGIGRSKAKVFFRDLVFEEFEWS